MVLSGTDTVDGQEIGKPAALQVDATEEPRIIVTREPKRFCRLLPILPMRKRRCDAYCP